MQAQKISAEHQMQESDHVHEMRMQILELQKEMQLLLAKAQLTPEPIKETPKKEGKS